MIGLVSLRCSVKEIAEEARQSAAYMCSRIHGDAPEVPRTSSMSVLSTLR
jgi:hypothetical protein